MRFVLTIFQCRRRVGECRVPEPLPGRGVENRKPPQTQQQFTAGGELKLNGLSLGFAVPADGQGIGALHVERPKRCKRGMGGAVDAAVRRSPSAATRPR